MLRRRMMMVPPPAQDWDVVWDYTMGLPEDNGFEKVIEANPQIEMTGDGLQIIPGIPGTGYVRYAPLEFETCNEGILEAVVLFAQFSSVNGFRMMLSDGTSGLQIFCMQDCLKFQSGASLVNIKSINTNTVYKIRIERVSGVNKIFLDDEKIYETEELSIQYVVGNRIFFQNAGEYLLKSIKFKKVS